MTTMKYLCIHRSSPGGQPQQPKPSAAQMQEMYAQFNTWKEQWKANILDMGGQLKPGGKVLAPSGVTDGPFVETKEVVGGFMIIAADSYEQALEVVRGCPGILRPGATVEIREFVGP